MNWFDLDTCRLQYTAISYVWEGSKKDSDIDINRKLGKTTESANEALTDPKHDFAMHDKDISNMCSGRILVVTENKQLGLFPAGTQKGDIVCVFLGGCVPFIIRAANDVEVDWEIYRASYQIIRHCYVHGIMYGEAIQDVSYWDSEALYIQ